MSEETDNLIKATQDTVVYTQSLEKKIVELEEEIDRLTNPPDVVTKMQVGLNICENHNYETDSVWANLFNRVSGTGTESQDKGWGDPNKITAPHPNLQLSPEGMPLVDVSCYSERPRYLSGTYKFRVNDPSRTAQCGFGGRASVVKNTMRREGDYILGDVFLNEDYNGNITFKIVNVNPNLYPRDFRLIVPGLPIDTLAVINPDFTNKTQSASCYRLSTSWCRINTNEAGTIVNWADRIQPGNFHKTSRYGVSYEDMISLANETGKSIWVSLPDMANDDYIQQAANLFAQRLNPSIPLWLEFSNERWNMAFPQGPRLEAAARANTELTATEASGNRKFQQNAFDAYRVGRIFKQVMGNRVRPVLGVQAAWPEQAEIGLSYLKQKYGNPIDVLYGVAITNYRTCTKTDTVDNIFNSIDFEGLPAKPGDRTQRDKDRQLATSVAQYGMKVLSYESAFFIKGGSSNPDDPKEKAQTDPRMKDVIKTLLSNFQKDTNAELLLYFYGIGKRVNQSEGRYPLAAELNTFLTEPKSLGFIEYSQQ